MRKRRRLPTPAQAVESAKKGMLDDLILHLSDEELREALADYRRTDTGAGEAQGRSGDEGQPRRARRSTA